MTRDNNDDDEDNDNNDDDNDKDNDNGDYNNAIRDSRLCPLRSDVVTCNHVPFWIALT